MNIEHFQISREELENRLRWYENNYGAYIGNKGVKNWKNLFRKPTLQEWTILFMLIMGLFIAWAYNRDIGECREFLMTIEDKACEICKVQTRIEAPLELSELSVPFINFNEENPDRLGES